MTTATTTAAPAVKLKPKEYRSAIEPTWCPGCGDYAVTAAICNALSANGVDPDNAVIVSGIGCSSRLPLWMRTFGFHSAHGRAIPVAVGMKVSRPELTVAVTIGDGDAFAIGGNHIPHAARRNIDMTLIVMDNGIYGLTKNQNSPTSREGLPGSLMPFGNIDAPMNVLALLLTYGATFVAQAFAGNPKQTGEIIGKAMAHKGFSYVNVLSPCPTYNKVDTFEYYRPRVQDIPADHDTGDFLKAIGIAEHALDHQKNPEGKVPIGLLYQAQKPVFGEKVDALKAKYKGTDTPDWEKILDGYKGH